MSETPQYKQPPLDPGFAQLMDQSRQDDIAAITARVQGDTSSLLARYGTQLAFSGKAGGSPLIA